MAVDMLTEEEFDALAKILTKLSLGDSIRVAAKARGYQPSTVTVSGDTHGPIDIRDVEAAERVREERLRRSSQAASAAEQGTPFGRKAMRLMDQASATYRERNAVYKDNFLVVGRVMEALFPNGAPRLHDAADFNRWHIFELMIVKITRYVANWDKPDEDSLVDLIPYAAILGAQDEDIREEAEQQADLARRAEHIGSTVSARRRVEGI